MEIQILSDLHLESPKGYDLFQIPPKAPYLALLGDIGNIVSHKDDVIAFLSRQLRQFQAVLFVPGNHEAYHSSWEETVTALRAFENEVRRDDSLGDFILLDRAAFHPPHTDVVVLGCSLFSHIPKESRIVVELGLNDFHQTENWSTAAHNTAHRRDLDWLNAQVGELGSREDVSNIMIFTHWSPSRDARTIDPRHSCSPITSAFSTNVENEECFGNQKVKVWAFGHTHFNCDVRVEREGRGVGALRLVANQRGYHSEQAVGFDIKKIIHL